jgi:Fe(3+) dicitrate transport protein
MGDGYKIQNGDMNRTNNGTPGTDANAIVKQEAVAAHVLQPTAKQLYIHSGLRLRSIKVSSLNYGTDLTRAGTNLTQAVNRVNVWIPGMGVLYKFNDDYNVFLQVSTRGSPPGAKVGEDAENSLNTELGFRFRKNALQGEIIDTVTSQTYKVLILCQVEEQVLETYSMPEQQL